MERVSTTPAAAGEFGTLRDEDLAENPDEPRRYPGTGQAVSDFVEETVDNIYREMNHVKEALGHSTGKVYHAILNNNKIVKFTIGMDGRLILDRTINSIYLQKDKLYEAQERLVKAGKLVPQREVRGNLGCVKRILLLILPDIRAAKRWRKVITGDPNKRIRDHMKEMPQVKWLDKFSFTLGVAVIILTEYLIFRHPVWFVPFYVYLMLFLFLVRFFMYQSQKMHFYLLDFCYVVNISCMLHTMCFPNNLTHFKVNYCMAMGPLCMAIILWNNSLVFHSLDRLTSCFLHAFPAMICHLFRWQLIPSDVMTEDDTIEFSVLYGPCIGIYLGWQITYLFLTEALLRDTLDADPEIQTSLRYLVVNYKNPTNRLVHWLCRKMNVLRSDEYLRPEQFLSKVVFVTCQLIYTIVLMIPPYLFYTRYYWSVAYLIMVFLAGTWNGASYYIEVFSKRYNLKFEKEPSKSDSPSKDPTMPAPPASSDSSVALDKHLNESQTVRLLEILQSLDEESSDSSEEISFGLTGQDAELEGNAKPN